MAYPHAELGSRPIARLPVDIGGGHLAGAPMGSTLQWSPDFLARGTPLPRMAPFPTTLNQEQHISYGSPHKPPTIGSSPYLQVMWPEGVSYQDLQALQYHPYAFIDPSQDPRALQMAGFSEQEIMGMMRKKSATRETTNALKAWLREHRRNPYPTKSEKIMLAIITKMTLTQVSTWFANARRRLKKEQKELEITSDTRDLNDQYITSSTESNRAVSVSPNLKIMTHQIYHETTDTGSRDMAPHHSLNVDSDDDNVSSPILSRSSSVCSSDATTVAVCSDQKVSKPKIWSVDDIINNKDSRGDRLHRSNHLIYRMPKTETELRSGSLSPPEHIALAANHHNVGL